MRLYDRNARSAPRLRKECANCGHHVSAHRYDPSLPRSGPQRCSVSGCPCTEYRRPEKGERIHRHQPQPDPSIYLSASEGRFRIISQGVPVAPDRLTEREALDDARRFKVKVADRFWDGDSGTWKPLEGHSPNARKAGRYVVSVPGLPGERVLDERYDEVGSPLEAAQRVASNVYATTEHPREIKVYDRESKRHHVYRHTGGELAPNPSHRERAASVLAGHGDPGSGPPIANPSQVDFFEDNRFVREGPLWQLSFGAYGSTHVYVWADGAESAFEEAVEWLDDNAPGMLVMVGEEDYQRAAEELGKVWDPSDPDSEVIETAEADMTMIGHTTLKHGNAVASWEWQMREIERGSDEWNTVVERSREESGEYEENGSLGGRELEVLLDVSREPLRRKLPAPGDSVVYDRSYQKLSSLGLIARYEAHPGTQSFADYYVLTPAGKETLRSRPMPSWAVRR